MSGSSPRRICVPIVGGLGNQMFLLATGIATALRNGLDLEVPHLEKSDSCGAPRPVYWKTMFKHIAPYMKFVDGKLPILSPESKQMTPWPDGAVVVPETEPAQKITFQENCGVLRGFFQSPIYFDDFKQHVKHLLVPSEYLQMALKEMKYKLFQCESHENDSPGKLLGIHIRRGDYLTMRDVFPILSLQEYYLPAIEKLLGPILLEEIPNLHSFPVRIIIFTEDTVYGELFRDMLRCKYPLLAANPHRVVLSSIRDDYIEMLSMSLCDDLIIANSSFSWWGAYLNTKPLHRIIAPSKWFIGRSPSIYCDHWWKI